jgi:quercetin dioxygenase-like cupin family protein
MRAPILLAYAALLTVPSVATAQEHHTTAQKDTLMWAPNPAYPAGIEMAIVHGDPTKPGTYVVRLKAPAGAKIAAHSHPNDENVTVLSGVFHIGTGDKLDESKAQIIRPGGYSFVAKGMTHYAWFSEPTEMQLHGNGPQGIVYVDPADDPRKKH